jgi:outer membrane immunogenic protein
MNKFLLATAAALCLGAPAQAADMPVKAPPMVAAIYTWTGFYVGANGGYGWSEKIHIGHLGDNPQGKKPRGGFFGGQAGYNFQSGRLVWGIEADFQGSGISSESQDLNFGDHFSTKLKWFGTARGRVGIAFNSFLPYVTGGFAYGRVVHDITGPVLVGAPYHLSRVATGYAAGGGIEYGFSGAWSAKLEYQFISLGRNDPVNAAGTAYSALDSEIFNPTRYHTLRLGLNYRFGGPVVARY